MTTVEEARIESGRSNILKGIPLLLITTFGWGANWPIMKIVLLYLPPLSFRGVCVLCGGLGILAVARIRGIGVSLPRDRVSQIIWLSIFNVVAWQVLSIYGLSYLPAGRASLLNSTMPLWCLPLSAIFLGEKITGRRIAALALGLGGVGLLMGDSFKEMSSAPLGIALMLLGAWSWALGIVLIRRWQVPIPTSVLTGWMLVIGGPPLLFAASLIDRPSDHWTNLSVMLGVLYNIIIVFMLCQWAWSRLVLITPIGFSSLSSLITPIVSIAVGSVAFHQAPTRSELVAMLLILGSLAIAAYRAPVREARSTA
jgi:drug/metabolite transporter (DMT)-like permease